MSEQPLDLRLSMRIMRRHWIVVGVVTLLGLAAGVAYAVRHPPLLSSSALVEVSSSSTGTATQVVIASSDDVLAGALHGLGASMSLLTLHKLVKVSSLAPGVLSITAEGKTAARAERTADAVANSYVAFLSSKGNGQKTQGRVLANGSNATGPSKVASSITAAGIGAFAGAVISLIGVLAFSRRDRRLRRRDEIADAIGVPVLASVSAAHPGTAARWSKLLTAYRPSSADAWRLRSALHKLGIPDAGAADAGAGSVRSLTVISLSSDKRALSLGPQLAVYAGSLGLPTTLVVGPQQDVNAAATLRAACAATPLSAQGSSKLRVAVDDHGKLTHLLSAPLTVVVAVVDSRTPHLDTTIQTDVAVLAVSAGAPTADQLARVAANAASAGHEIEGILIADPDAADQSTGRIPRIGRTVHRVGPTRLTGTTTETGL